MKHETHIGKTFARITVIGMAARRADGAKTYRCRCVCGAEFETKATHVVSGRTRSCGCLLSDFTVAKNSTHGKSKTAEYVIWCGMKARCFRPSNTSYKNYGARGISVCDRWRDSFEDFLADMGTRPAGYSLERIDVDGDYAPSNCKWIPLVEQAHNTRRSKFDRELANEVRDLCALGLPKASIARALNLNYSSVKQVAYGKQWR